MINTSNRWQYQNHCHLKIFSVPWFWQVRQEEKWKGGKDDVIPVQCIAQKIGPRLQSSIKRKREQST